MVEHVTDSWRVALLWASFALAALGALIPLVRAYAEPLGRALTSASAAIKRWLPRIGLIFLYGLFPVAMLVPPIYGWSLPSELAVWQSAALVIASAFWVALALVSGSGVIRLRSLLWNQLWHKEVRQPPFKRTAMHSLLFFAGSLLTIFLLVLRLSQGYRSVSFVLLSLTCVGYLSWGLAYGLSSVVKCTKHVFTTERSATLTAFFLIAASALLRTLASVLA